MQGDYSRASGLGVDSRRHPKEAPKRQRWGPSGGDPMGSELITRGLSSRTSVIADLEPT